MTRKEELKLIIPELKSQIATTSTILRSMNNNTDIDNVIKLRQKCENLEKVVKEYNNL